MNLTDHFSLEEMTFTAVGKRLGIANLPGPDQLANLRRVCEVMEYIRHLLGDHAIVVHSAFRNPRINNLVGGVTTSAHVNGLACDFICPDYGPPWKVAEQILNCGLDYDQLILEYGWVHVAIAETGPGRREALTKRSSFAPYEQGINA
jgi:zinc D-Ala-D-Ala carboxypeptidase